MRKILKNKILLIAYYQKMTITKYWCFQKIKKHVYIGIHIHTYTHMWFSSHDSFSMHSFCYFEQNSFTCYNLHKRNFND